MRILIEIHAGDRYAEFCRDVPRPAPDLDESREARAAACAADLVAALRRVCREAEAWLETTTGEES